MENMVTLYPLVLFLALLTTLKGSPNHLEHPISSILILNVLPKKFFDITFHIALDVVELNLTSISVWKAE